MREVEEGRSNLASVQQQCRCSQQGEAQDGMCVTLYREVRMESEKTYANSEVKGRNDLKSGLVLPQKDNGKSSTYSSIQLPHNAVQHSPKSAEFPL